MKKILILLLLLLAPATYGATINASSASQAAVQAAVTASADGDTVIIPAGTGDYIGTNGVLINKRITIQGAGIGSTILRNTGSYGQGIEEPIFHVAVGSGQVTIHDIRFTSNTYDVNDGVRSSSLGAKLVIYNCQFDNFSFGLKIWNGFGLCYNTTFLNNDNHARVSGYNNISAFSGFADGPPPWGWNSQNYFVFEDCTFTRQNWMEDTYSIDSEYPANYMVRHCTFNESRGANVQLDGLDMHGVNPGTVNVPLGIVAYANQWIFTGAASVNGSKLFDIRGGSNTLIFDNTSTGPGTWGGSARMRAEQNNFPTIILMTNTYFYNNTANSTLIVPSAENGNTPGVNYFLSAPSPQNILPYPHPLRGGTPPPTGPFYISPSGNDANAGTQASPWLTIAKANSTLTAGQTVFLRGGTYTGGPIAPVNSGTAGNPITFSAFSGETPVISGRLDAINLLGKDYVVIDGLTITNVDQFFTINNGQHNIIQNCTIGPVRNNNRWAGGQIFNNSRFNQLLNCTVHTYGTEAFGSDDGTVIEIGTELDSTNSDDTSFNLVQNCRLYDGGHHVIGLHGHQNILKNSYISNDNWSAGFGNRCVYLLGYANNNYRCLVDNCRIAWAAAAADQPGEGQAGILIASPFHIIRKNAIFRNDASGIYDAFSSGYPTEGDNVKIYNNTFYANGLSPGTGFPNVISLADWENIAGRDITGVAIKNNLFSGNGNNAIQYYNTAAGSQTVSNNFDSTTNGNPLFTDITTAQTAANGGTFPNLNLSSGSPAIDFGAALTTITSATGSGTSFSVSDAGYFCDGWGITTGDVIRIVGSATTATISAINYVTNTITVSSPISWTGGAGIALDYNGSAPDAGAFEVSGAPATPTLSSATINVSGNQLTLVFSTPVQAGSGGTGGWTLNATPAAGLSFSSGTGTNTLIYNITGRVINFGESVTLSYAQPGNGIESVSSGTDLAAISNRAVVNNASQGQASTPVITLPAGPYFGTQTTTITDADSGAGAVVHYTTDGSVPTAASPVYSTPVTIAINQSVKAIATWAGHLDSGLASSDYEVVSWVSVGTSWKTFQVPQQSSTFTWKFSVTAPAAGSDGVVGIGPAPVSGFTGMACIINFAAGTIQARNGGAYVVGPAYTPGTIYNFVATINCSTHTWTVTSTPASGSPTTTIVSGAAFRTEQATASQLSYIGIQSNIGVTTTSAMSFPAGASSARYIGLRGVPAAGGAVP